MAHILVIHDRTHTRQLMIDELRLADHTAFSAARVEDARASARAATSTFHVVLAGVPAVGGCAEVIAQIKSEWPTADIVLIGEAGNLAAAVEAIRHGAYDYIADPPDRIRLLEAVRGAMQRSWNLEAGRSRGAYGDAEEIVSRDAKTRAVFSRAKRAAPVNSTVLITGESGTGKEILARHIHKHSPRRRSPFVPVNCGSLPENLIETELFGYKKGAFTGAAADTKGLIEEAAGGVLFLDEIGDMPLAMQVRLLRFLDSGEVRAVGGTSVKHVDVRVVAATNRCLRSEIANKRFREDLFFRLSVVSLHLPPLRERQADIASLVHYHIRRASLSLGVPARAITNEALWALEQYHWPGNIRELQNVMEHALLEASPGLITSQQLPDHVVQGRTPSVARTVRDDDADDPMIALLQQHRGNYTKTAEALGISRTTLWRRLRRHARSEVRHHAPESRTA